MFPKRATPSIWRAGFYGFAALAMTSMSGCASLSESECLAGDWRAIGYEDGAAGREMSRVGSHRKACADYKVSPDLDLYRSGREQGLQSYCTVSKGFSEGAANHAYRGVCPAALEADFLEGYETGRELYALRQVVQDEEAALRAVQRDFDAVGYEISEERPKLSDNDLSDEQRARIRERIADLEARQDQLGWDIREAQDRVYEARAQAEEFEREARWL